MAFNIEISDILTGYTPEQVSSMLKWDTEEDLLKFINTELLNAEQDGIYGQRRLAKDIIELCEEYTKDYDND